ncbi:hypothetical protein ABG768_016113 [Culter alburnus]|uniref:Uncharacterized protein n=1 Tax=Culter alburnus TaxID=194366 RepID=A0AAW1YXZ8_CULAL
MSGLVFRERHFTQSDSLFTLSLYRGEQQENDSGYPLGQETNFGTRETPFEPRARRRTRLQESRPTGQLYHTFSNKLHLTQVCAAGRHQKTAKYHF